MAGDQDSQWRDITKHQYASSAQGGEPGNEGGGEREVSIQFGNGGRNIHRKGRGLYQAEVGPLVNKVKAGQCFGKQCFRGGGEQAGADIRAKRLQGFQDGDGPGGMTQTMRGDKAGDFRHGSRVVVVRMVTGPVEMAVAVDLCLIAAGDTPGDNFVEGGGGVVEEVPVVGDDHLGKLESLENLD